QVGEARANLRRLQAGTTAERIAVARAAVSKAQDAVKFAHGKLARSKQLFDRQALSPQEFEAAQEQAATAENDLTESRGQLRVFLRGNRPEEIEAAKAQVDRLEAQQHFLETQLGLLDVVSPATGVRTFVITTQVDNRSGLLKPGMTGLAKVVGGDRRVVDLVMRRLAHTFKVEFWSWW